MNETAIHGTDGEGGERSMAGIVCVTCFVAAVVPSAALAGAVKAPANRTGDGGYADTRCRFRIRTFRLSLLPGSFAC